MSTTAGGARTWSLPAAMTALNALLGQDHVSPTYVRLRMALLTAQWDIYGKLLVEHSTSGSSRNISAQESPLTPDDVSFDPELLESLFSALNAAVRQHGENDVALVQLASQFAQDPSQLVQFARAAAFGSDQDYLESLADHADTPLNALLFVGRTLAAPFVSAVTANRPQPKSKISKADDSPRECPACASVPGLAWLTRDKGARTLFCSLCGAAWAHKRLVCPFCGSQDPDGLSYIRIDEQDARWLETCQKCNCYIKTVDERKLPHGATIIPVAEDTATLHLDLLADQEGFSRRQPYTACY
ncbi:MAG: formate dehydrogenase accessory protein FdhE [Planctomycetota bacterium]